MNMREKRKRIKSAIMVILGIVVEALILTYSEANWFISTIVLALYCYIFSHGPEYIYIGLVEKLFPKTSWDTIGFLILYGIYQVLWTISSMALIGFCMIVLHIMFI